MRFDRWILGLQTLNVLVLLWILRRFLFVPLDGTVQKRREAALRNLEAAEASRRAAQEAQASAEAEARAAAEARRGLMEAAARDAERDEASMLAEARKAADALLAAARARAEDEGRREVAASSDRAARLAVETAARALACLPEAAEAAPFIDGLSDAVAGLPEETRRELPAAPVAVRAPRALSEDERGALTAALSRAPGAEARLAPSADAGLIAGLEIAGAHGGRAQPPPRGPGPHGGGAEAP